MNFMGQASVHILHYIQTGAKIAKWQMEIFVVLVTEE